MYNISSSTSTTEETDTSGGTRTTETENNQKDVIKDSGSNIVTAQGASNPTTKSNIIAAVEAVTGASNHKIQVFEMKEE